MELSPLLYHHLIRPKWFTKIYIYNVINQSYQFTNKRVLDFGSGTGCNCSMFEPGNYFGVDIDLFRVNYAKRLYPEYSFSVFKNETLPFEDNYFDYLLIVAVLHHVSNKQIEAYQEEFHRVLRKDGTILVIEPCFCKDSTLNNGLMKFFDNGKFIRYEKDYLALFDRERFQTDILKRFKKVFYNEIFFSATAIN